ncbi:MAG: nitrite reductase small subunit NirD [Pseudomonadota bacterium]
MSGWIDVGALEEIPIRGARVVKTAQGCIAIFRTGEDEVFALEDRCPHLGGPLSEGIVHDRAVTCPLHNWVISFESGEAQGADEGHVATFRARLEDGRILLDPSAIGRNLAA